ncbi:hypothetical protein G6028_06465 [Dietzia cercidiphylli]|uniref:Uncharacterized protein n=2 Tax=Dietziaceae TaxID=85029 RepID=A0ABN2IJM4_9ACTN|nr:hypothetical protein [Dietzia cercidiphylli]MBB1050077.1 hypothetical protein [Dietzia sp. CW19]MBB1058283.1 hypothetical protein [Dietzia sp. B19]MBC7295887.1 hypothetical protein [Dietzia sp.]
MQVRRRAGRALAAVALVASMAGVSTLVATPTSAAPVPSPAEVVRETGSWFAHGYTLDLRADGTGMLAAWVGAFDGTRVQVRLIPAPGPATVAEVTAVETVGRGGLAPEEQPGIGGLVTIAVGDEVRTAHVEWSSGPRRLAVDLCPTEGLDAEMMAVLRCGA